MEEIFTNGSDIGLIQGQKFTTTITTNGAGDFSPITFSYLGKGRPDCFIVGNLTRTDGVSVVPVAVTAASINYNLERPVVTISGINGLVANTTYNITVVVL